MEHNAENRIALALEAALHVWREERNTLEQLLDAVREIRDAIKVSNQPMGFLIKETNLTPQRSDMADKLKATGVNLDVLDDGKGVLYTLTPVNAAGRPVSLPAGSGPVQATSSDPAMTLAPDPGDDTLTPPRPADTTGLVFLGSITQPPKDVAGIVATFTDTLTSGTVISTSADPVNIVPDPNNPNNPTGFMIVEAAV